MNVPFPMFPGWARPMTTTPDLTAYAADAQKGPTAEQLSSLSGLVARLVSAENVRGEAERRLKEAQAEEDELRLKLIPELMRAAGTLLYVTSDGKKVEVSEVVKASIPVAQRDAAHDWLDQNGQGGMVKRAIEVPFGRDSEDAAMAELEALREAHPDARVTKKVEASTLTAWVRERLRAGEAVPEDLFSVHRFDAAKVTQKKQ